MKRAGTIAAIIFAVSVFAAYFVRLFVKEDKAFGEFLDFFQHLILPWLWLLVLALAAYMLGSYILRFLDKPKTKTKTKTKTSQSSLDLSVTEKLLYSIGIGFSLITMTLWGLGWVHLLYKPVLVAVIAVILLVFRREAPVVYNDIKVLGKRFREIGGFDKALIWLLIIWVARTIFVACNPSIGGDPISTHLYSPKLYLENHAIIYYTWFQFLQFHSMLVSLQLVFFRDPGSILPFFFMLMTAGAIYLIGRQYFSRTAGLMGALLYVILPMCHTAAMQNLIEHTLAFYIVLAFYAVLKFNSTGNRIWLGLSGMSAGSACGIDINGLIPATLIVILAFKNFWRVLIWMFIFALPWYIPNVVYFGNPIYPFYEGIFGWANWGLMEADTIFKRDPGYLREIQGKEPSFLDSLTVLWRYTFKPNVDWVTQPVGRIGPFILALTPIMFFIKWKKEAKLIGIFILVAYLYWFAYEQIYNARMLLYIFALHGLLGAWGLARAIKAPAGKKVWWPQITFITAIVIFAGWVTLNYVDNDVLVTDSNRQQFLFRNKPGIVHVDAINQTRPDSQILVRGDDDELYELGPEQKAEILGPDSAVYLLGLEYYWFYCDFEIVGAKWGNSNWIDYYDNATSPADLSAWLKSLGCDLLLLERGILTEDPERNYSSVMNHPEWDTYFEQLLTPQDLMFPDMATNLYFLGKIE